jgi:hypothetical protein
MAGSSSSSSASPYVFERYFSPAIQATPIWAAADWMRTNLWLPTVVTIAYLVMLFVGQRMMRNREPAKLKWTLTVWNAGKLYLGGRGDT